MNQINRNNNHFKTKFAFSLLFLSGFFFYLGFKPVNADSIGQEVIFNIQSDYDSSSRDTIRASLLMVTNKLYFYVDKNWWTGVLDQDKNIFRADLYTLANKFEQNDYVKLITTFGSEPKMNGENHLTILLCPMPFSIGGYARSIDLYKSISTNSSNEREMVYLNSAKLLDTPQNKLGAYLAHEFTHLIAIGQKDKKFGVIDDIWLSEARAEYSATLLGYDDDFSGSNLEQRMNDFWSSPSVSFLDWQNNKYNYAAANLFTQYLVDTYGVKVLVDTLQTKEVGVKSINYALKNNGFNADFNQVFQDWMITVLLNDCSLGNNYCYKNSHLKNFRIFPTGYYYPTTGDGTMNVSYTTKPYQGNWYKIVGGKNILKLEFQAQYGTLFRIPYAVLSKDGKETLGSLILDSATQKGAIYIPDFNNKNIALYIMPYNFGKLTGIINPQDGYGYSWKLSTVTSIGTDSNNNSQCSKFNNNLYFGLRNNNKVKCLQQFLTSHYSNYYPSGLVTGNYLSLTFAAVKKLQAFKRLPQTGYFGPLTRGAINPEL